MDRWVYPKLARLLTFPNVLVTAHQAFLTHEALNEIARVTVENVRRFASKQALLEESVVCQPVVAGADTNLLLQLSGFSFSYSIIGAIV